MRDKQFEVLLDELKKKAACVLTTTGCPSEFITLCEFTALANAVNVYELVNRYEKMKAMVPTCKSCGELMNLNVDGYKPTFYVDFRHGSCGDE